MFKAATFNANSIRSRLDIIVEWLSAERPDVLCVQETKAQDKDFPLEAIADAGWHVVFRGEKSYNGVAILSREVAENVAYGFDDGGPADEARLIRARFGSVDVVNTYVPQGQAVDSPVFAYKLEWFARLRRLFEKRYSADSHVLWMGDLNVAPEPRDVYDAKHLAGSVCFHPDEQAALRMVMDWGLVDVFRMHNAQAGEYSFWDYRVPNAVKRNIGWRLDHIIATKSLAAVSRRVAIDREPRLLVKPSDHTFVIAEFDI